MEVLESKDGKCPKCYSGYPHTYEFKNSDEYLRKETKRVTETRKESGLEGLVGGLAYVIMNVELQHQKKVVSELVARTGLHFRGAFTGEEYVTAALSTGIKDAADFLIRSRKKQNPFTRYNLNPKSRHLPNTRLETFVFTTPDIEAYVEIQKSRGVQFLSEIVHADSHSFVQTSPSSYTGNSTGFIEGEIKNNFASHGEELNWKIEKPDIPYLKNIKKLDHAATRVRATDRDAAIIEFMELTNYAFDFAMYVKMFNSITNVARLSPEDFAMVFTSGISPYIDENESGPTEKFIHDYGTRVHHIAFCTENIEDTVAGLAHDGMDFLIGLVGSEDEGLKQTFSVESAHTLLVNEYIHRFGDFDGFFTKSNVTLLTEATGKQ
jgi:hypothetical protein